jgi:hypothetical protein
LLASLATAALFVAFSWTERMWKVNTT